MWWHVGFLEKCCFVKEICDLRTTICWCRVKKAWQVWLDMTFLIQSDKPRRWKSPDDWSHEICIRLNIFGCCCCWTIILACLYVAAVCFCLLVSIFNVNVFCTHEFAASARQWQVLMWQLKIKAGVICIGVHHSFLGVRNRTGLSYKTM